MQVSVNASKSETKNAAKSEVVKCASSNVASEGLVGTIEKEKEKKK